MIQIGPFGYDVGNEILAGRRWSRIAILVARGTGVRRLALLFAPVDGHFQTVRVGTTSPTRDARHLKDIQRVTWRARSVPMPSAGQKTARSPPVIDALVDFGDRASAGDSAESCFFTKRSLRRFAAYLGTEARHFERYRAAYAIVGADGQVITTCWRL